ncbi:MAG: AAA family ATPase [Clostridia bacterium]|nr:AAA family ATPase [Clostridia bacterium]
MNAFKNIIGYNDEKEQLYQIIDMFRNMEMYRNMGADIPAGILISGDPGLGKTTLAKAFMEECNVDTYILKKRLSNGATIREINTTFARAMESCRPAIILIDDMDKFSESQDKYVDDSVFVAIQAGIDSVKENGNIIVVATANDISKFPESLLRSGRFDRQIELMRPTPEESREIIKYYLKDKNTAEHLNLDDVSKMISYRSCAELETILNESAILATYKRKPHLDIDDIAKVYLGTSKEDSFSCDMGEFERIAIHEAGHAVVAEALKESSVGAVCIRSFIDARKSAGTTHLSYQFMRRPENVMIALGGKAAVELFYEGRCGSGCNSDLHKAIHMLRDGITSNATSGMAFLDTFSANSSPEYIQQIEAVVHSELERYMFLVRDILIKNRDFLMKVYERLKEKKYLLSSDIENIRSTVNVTEFQIP